MKYKKMHIKKVYLNKKGFTLVELIATIVILGAIALITTPIVLNTIKRSKSESYIRSCEEIEKGAQLYVNNELGGIVENDMVIPVSKLNAYVSNINSAEDYVLVKVSTDGTTKYYYTGREKNPNDNLVSLKDTIENYQIKKNVKVNGTTVNKVYGNKTNKESLKNYVWFSGHLWQIVETNDLEGTIKLVTANAVTSIAYGDTNNWENSWVRKWLYNEFYENLDRKDLIKDTKFCVDIVDSLPTNYTKKESCNNVITEKVGLLTYEDYIYAKDATTIQNGNSYLAERSFWFITSPTLNDLQWHSETTTETRIILESEDNYGVETWDKVNAFGYGVRPVISIKDDVLIKSGTGIKSDPYILSNELILNSSSFASDLKVGNYVYLDESNNPYLTTITEIVSSGVEERVSSSNIRYRVVKINEDGSVKLIRASILTGLPYDIAYSGKYMKFNNNDVYSSYFSVKNSYNYTSSYNNGTLGEYLNKATNSFYNWYSSKTKSMIKLSNWNIYTSGQKKDYSNLNTSTSTSYPSRTNDGTLSINVGLPIWGEMFSAGDLNYGYWLLNRYPGSTSIADITASGMGNATNSTYDGLAVRPVVNIKPETYIIGGSGTINDPYRLDI